MSTNRRPPQLFGRDAFIAQTWESLATKSLYMNDLRRIGKTRIIQQMEADPPTGWLTAYSDLEGAHTAKVFAALVYKASEHVLKTKQKVLRRTTALLGKVAGVEVVGILKLPDGRDAPWKDVLRMTFDDVATALAEHPDHRMVFLWDEVPYLLENIAKRQGSATAEQVLDILRELSQRHDSIRLLLTGSIGIHHVLRSLWAAGYRGSPLNHMDLIQPGPLAAEPAKDFARSELVRRGLRCADAEACAARTADLACNVPFYIEKLVARLPRDENLTPARIESELERELRSDTSDWDLGYYDRRVKVIFPETRMLVLTILDCIARADSEALEFRKIRRLVANRLETDDEVLREHLTLLCMDHYLVRDAANAYRFYLPLVRRWWTISRSLRSP